MSLRALVVLVVVLAAAIAALYWLHAPAPKTGTGADAPLVAGLKTADVTAVDITCGVSSLALERDGSAWRIVRPVATEADPRHVKELLDALVGAKVRKVVGNDGAHRDAYGLAPAACAARLTATGGAPVATVALGRSSPIGSDRYASSDDKTIVLTEGSLFGVMSRGADGFREKRLIPVDADAISKVSIDAPTGPLVLSLAAGTCRVERPVTDQGSPSACSNLTRTLTSTELSGPYDTKPPTEVHADRRLRIQVEAGAGSTVAFVAASGVAGKRLAWREGASFAGLIDEATAGEIAKPVDSFRSSQIVTFSTPDLRRIAIERDAGTLAIERAGATTPWTGSGTLAGTPIDPDRVEAFLDSIRGLTAAGFVTEAHAAAGATTVVLSGEKAEIARFVYGPRPSAPGDAAQSVWATTPSRPGAVFKLDATVLARVPKGPGDLAPQPAAPPRPSP